jgi:hypothetical protein
MCAPRKLARRKQKAGSPLPEDSARGWSRKCTGEKHSRIVMLAKCVTPIDAYTETLNTAIRTERRRRTRVAVHWRALLQNGTGETIDTITQNISSSGLYCLSPRPLTPGDCLIVRVLVPAHDPNGEGRMLTLECKVSIMRCESAADGLFGIACSVQEYHLTGGGLYAG